MQLTCISGRDRFESASLKRITSSLLCCCWLWALALAASPALHEWAHGGEAGHEDHDCVVKLLVLGGCDAPDAAPALVVAPVEFSVVSWSLAGRDVPGAIFLSGTLEHGPPAPRA